MTGHVEGLIVQRSEYAALLNAPTEHRWEVQRDDTIGGWCITLWDIPGSPANGNPPIMEFVSEEVARYVVALHNDRLPHDGRIKAPFTSEQVRELNRYQQLQWFHPFTCQKHPGRHGDTLLTARENGWVCSDESCDYVQFWAWEWMADRENNDHADE